MIDLAADRLGGLVVWVDDEWFAAADNLLLPSKPVWDEHRFTPRGKWMDGWESRRRRSPHPIHGDRDTCVIRLGARGVVRQLVVDTAHFTGNYPERCAVQAVGLMPGQAPTDGAGWAALPWVDLVPTSPLQGDTVHTFDVADPRSWTHLRLVIEPDGGVARLRALGEPCPAPDRWAAASHGLDLASSTLGARATATSDDYFGSADHLLHPDSATHMGDGWENRRRRDDGHDWVELALAARGVPRLAEIDTRHFKGNAPGAALLEARDGDGPWRTLLPETPLQAHWRHELALTGDTPVTQVRLRVFPDGGVARLRLPGHLAPGEGPRRALDALTRLPEPEAVARFQRCCGATRWAEQMATRRPFEDSAPLLAAADAVWETMGEDDWLEAFAAHPRIGQQAGGWSAGEQASMADARDEVRRRLAEKNDAYYERHGFIFIICATGKSPAQMLAALESRLDNDREAELRAAAAEQGKITRLRLIKWLGLTETT